MFGRRVTQEYIERFASNVAISLLPSVLGSIVTSFKEIAAEREADEKFDKLGQSIAELERLTAEIKKNTSFSPTSTQVMLADVVLAYVDQDMDDALFSMASVDDLVMSENCIAMNMTTPSSPEEVVESVRKVLGDYHVQIKATAYY